MSSGLNNLAKTGQHDLKKQKMASKDDLWLSDKGKIQGLSK